MGITSRSKLISICSGNPEYYYKDILDLDNEMTKQFKAARDKGLLPQYLSAPAYMMWEITSRCPQKCIYCYNSSNVERNELSSKELFNLADQIIEMKPFNICVTGGEPTLRNEYYESIRYLSSSGILVGTILSGVGMTEKKAMKIASCAQAIQVSLDSSREEVHDFLRQRKGCYKDAVRTIKYFTNHGVKLNISFAATKVNIDEFPEFHEFVSKLGVDTLRTQKLAISGRAKANREDLRPTQEQYKRYLEYIEKNSNVKGLCRIEYGDPSVHIKSGLEYEIAVLARISSTGDVGLSPYFDIYFGNIREQKLKDIWNKMKNGWVNPKVKKILSDRTSVSDSEIIDNMYETVVV